MLLALAKPFFKFCHTIGKADYLGFQFLLSKHQDSPSFCSLGSLTIFPSVKSSVPS
nr:MAG TPA: hypothetical protein [Caudoviricetes sp.]